MRRPWFRAALVRGVALALALVVATGCGSTRGDADVELAAQPPWVSDDPVVVTLVTEYRARAVAAPHDARAQAELAMVYEANGLWQLAAECFARAADLDHTAPLYRFHYATSAIRAGDVVHGHQALAALVRSAPDLAPAQQMYGYAALDQGDHDSARAAFDRLIALAPEAPFGYIGAAEVAVARDDFAHAVNLLEPVLGRDPTLTSARHILGLAYRGLGRDADANRELALGLNSSRVLILDAITRDGQRFAVNLADQIRQARSLHGAGRTAQAIPLLEQAAAARPDNAQVRRELATFYLDAGRGAEAESALRAAITIEPESYDSRLALGHTLLGLGRHDEAIAAIDVALALDPTLANGPLAKARALHQLGRDAEAGACLDRAALDGSRLDAGVLLELAGLELDLGRADAAQAHFVAATLAAPAIAGAAHLGLAHLALARGDLGTANSELALARKTAPHHPMLAMAEQRLSALSTGAARP